jgi:hypothetical protein
MAVNWVAGGLALLHVKEDVNGERQVVLEADVVVAHCLFLLTLNQLKGRDST